MVRRSENVAQAVAERGSEAIHDLAERGEELTHDLSKRTDKLTRKLAKRGRKMTRDLAERGEEWLKPERKQKRAIWMAAGFSVGLVVAGVITYRLVRGRAIQILEEGEESIELPQNDAWNGTPGRPVGEILHLDVSGTGVATLEVIDVTSAESSERPADAAFVGVVLEGVMVRGDATVRAADLVGLGPAEGAKMIDAHVLGREGAAHI